MRNLQKEYKEKGFKRFLLESVLQSGDSPLKKSLSVFLGVFIGLTPLWGFQSILALFLAFVFRLNKVIAFAFSLISLPPLIPFIILAGYSVGNFLIGEEKTNLSLEDFKNRELLNQQTLVEYLVGGFALALSTASIAGIISYLILNRKKTEV